MEKRSIWQKVFGGFVNTLRSMTRFQFMSGYSPTFSSFGNNAYASDIVRSAVHAIASNAAKLKPKHIRRIEGDIRIPGSSLERLLTIRPNPMMNTYDFLYKIVTQLCLRSNAFILIQWNGMQYSGFYPIIASTVETLEYEDEMYLRFQLANGKRLTVPYADVIHLRRFFYESDMFGETSDTALLPTLELIHATNQGIINAIKSSAFLRGILKFTTMLKPEDIKKQRDEFIKDYLDMTNNGGVAATDSKADYVPLNNDPKMIDAKQMQLIENKVYKYFNVNEKIVTSSYTEDDWNAFYESVLEPIALQLSLEFTSKVFTSNEQSRGNEVIFEANRLQYASVKTKLDLREMVDRGAMTPNEWREAFNLGPLEGGDKPIRRLDTAEVKNEPKAKDDSKKGEEDDDDTNDNDE